MIVRTPSCVCVRTPWGVVMNECVVVLVRRKIEVQLAVIGIDPGMGGKDSDESHCVLLAGSDGVVYVLYGRTIKNDEHVVRPLTHVKRLVEFIKLTDNVVRYHNGDATVMIFVAIEANLARMANVYFQYVHLLYGGTFPIHNRCVFVGSMLKTDRDEEENEDPEAQKTAPAR